MPDINNAIALGVQPPPPQKPTDIIAPITSLAQLNYLNSNAEKVKAETGQIGQTTQFTAARNRSIQDYTDRRTRGEDVPSALSSSGLAAYDPTAANAILGNVKSGNELTAVRNYVPGNPASLAAGGPEMVGKELTNQSTAATTQKTGIENTQAQTQFYGQLGNVMTSDPSPKGREIAAALARQRGVPEQAIQQFMRMSDKDYMAAGQHFQQAAMNPEPYYRVSGQEAFNIGKANAATSIQKVEPGQQVFMGPGAREAFTGAAPASGVVGQPSLGNFAPSQGAPSLTPPQAPAAPQAAPIPARNVNAVATPSVGVNVPSVVTAAGNKYGISPEYMARTFQIESGGNPNAYNAQSKAAGPFQFVPSTGAKYLNGASPFDVAGSADAAARLASDNKAALTQALGRSPSDAELYLAHQQGAQGAAKLLTNPNARAGDLVGNSAILSNGGNPNAPASAFTNLWATKFNGGVGRSIPTAATAPNVTPVAPAGPAIPGSVAPLAVAALTPQPSPNAPPPSQAGVPLQPAPTPIPNAAPATPVQPVNGPAPPATGLAADNTRPLAPVISGMSKATVAEQQGYGEGLGKVPAQLDAAATSAKATNATLDQMQQASDSWRMGKWADKEETAREGLQAVAKTLGINTPGLDKPIADYQDFAKLSGQILRQASHETSSRVGVMEMQLISKSLPSPEMSEGGFKQVATQMKGLNDFAIAKQQAAANWKAANGSLAAEKSGKDFQSTWNANASPAAFVLHRMQQENPQGLQNLVSTMSKTAEGREALKNMKSQMQWANNAGLFGG